MIAIRIMIAAIEIITIRKAINVMEQHEESVSSPANLHEEMDQAKQL